MVYEILYGRNFTKAVEIMGIAFWDKSTNNNDTMRMNILMNTYRICKVSNVSDSYRNIRAAIYEKKGEESMVSA